MHQRRQNSLTNEEVIVKFRERVSDILVPKHDDHFLCRWLRARHFDLDKSEQMLRKSLTWREKMGADRIIDEWDPPKVLREYFVGGMCGHDKEGRPVCIVPIGHLDMKGLTLSTKRATIRKYGCRRIEEMCRECKNQSEKLDHRIDMVTLVMDLDHFSMRNLLMPGMDLLLQIMGQTEANYPETLKIAFVINAPTIFPIIFKACKLFLSEDTKKKINLLGSNWKEILLEHIEPCELPEHWGGTATDPDGDTFCRTKVCMGGDVPESYHIKPEALVDMDRVTSIVVPRISSHDVCFNVKEPAGKVLRWVFWTEDYDIKFKVSFTRDSSDEVETLKPLRRVQCQLVPEDGVVVCSNAGTYTMTFDNTHWLHKKKLFYVAEILEGDGGNCTDVSSGSN